ncbi:21956_t:CDS:1, partial [Dentiscutata erythropus]
RPLVINTINNHLQNNKQIVAHPSFKPPPRGSSLASFQQSNQISNFNGNDASKNGSNIRQSRLSSLGDINEHEEGTNLKIPDFPVPPEKSIVPKPSLEKSIVPKPSLGEPIIPKHESQDPSELIKKPGKSHKHYNAAQKALELFKFLANDWDSWNFYAESKGVKIYQ